MKITLFKDPAFKAVPEYNADDVANLLNEQGASFREVSHGEIASVTRSTTDLLVVPYIQGTFSEPAFDAILAFHSDGGSLLFLGDLPSIGAWFPYRNMRAFELHMTRCNDPVAIDGLTEAGEEILGELKDIEFFADRKPIANRYSAFPPDISRNLISNNPGQWEMPCVVVVERKCEKFFGARLAVVGFNGGEPRTNVIGGYERDYQYDPGMLNREWTGANDMIWKLIRWLEPEPMAGTIALEHYTRREGESNRIDVRLANNSATPLTLDSVILRNTESGKELLKEGTTTLKPGAVWQRNDIAFERDFGIHSYQLVASRDSLEKQLAELTEYVYPRDASDHCGFGFSAFHAFRDQTVSDEFKFFARELLKSGLQYLRVYLPWEDLEPKPGEYNWSIPDQLIAFADEENIRLRFEVMPTVLGTHLCGDGIPRWILEEPAISRDGKEGFFPTIWSEFYRSYYFAMIEELTRRYADEEQLDRFTIDFGNSDFPYGYFYYYNDRTLFDYSPQEREAFARYLRDIRDMTLEEINILFDKEFASFEEIPVPLAKEDPEAWRMYLSFRSWSIQDGIQRVADITRKNAPKMVPADLPGHGAGSIADASTNCLDVHSRHWWDEKIFGELTHSHNAGETWGGEAWEVGGYYPELDDAVYNSIRYNATYNTLPGPDLGIDSIGIPRIGFIRRTMMNARRRDPEIAIIDQSHGWPGYQSYIHISQRLDQTADLLDQTNRFLFDEHYRLLVMPPADGPGSTVTGGSGGQILPADKAYYWLLRQSVERGMNLLVFPNTCVVGRDRVQMTFLRQTMNLMDVSYGDWSRRDVEFPEDFGGGQADGFASEVIADGEVLISDTSGKPILVRRPLGKGAVYLAGYDNREDSLDGVVSFHTMTHIPDHTLVRLINHLNLGCRDFRTEQLYAYKDLVHRGEKSYFILYSDLVEPVSQRIDVRLPRPPGRAYDLATGEEFDIRENANSWYSFTMTSYANKGRYISFHD